MQELKSYKTQTMKGEEELPGAEEAVRC